MKKIITQHHKHKVNHQLHTYHKNNHKSLCQCLATKKKLLLLSIFLLIALFISKELFLNNNKIELVTNQKQYYFGVGVGITFRDGRAIVSRIIPGTPAERAGILLNDIVTAVDSVPVSAENSRDLCREIRGKEGSVINLSIKRQNNSFEKILARTKIYSRTPTMCQ